MTSLHDEVLLSYSFLRNGEVSGNNLCPKCKGGARQERSFSVGRQHDYLWWRCWRDGCKFKGGARDGAVITKSVSTSDINKRKMNYHPYSMPDSFRKLMLEKTAYASLIDECHWTPLFSNGDRGRAVVPIQDRNGKKQGAILRSYTGQTPKVLTDVGDYGGCAWRGNTSHIKTLVIVEDVFSASRIGDEPELTAAALLGTTLTVDKLMDIVRSRPEKCVVCLDADATRTAIEVSTKIGHYVPCKILRLENSDIKNMSAEEFTNWKNEIKSLTG